MATDFEGLKQIGLSYIRNASRKTWTDLGVHDPGVTMLEQLCFALVDLGYRTSFDLKDIMADMPRGESLVGPESILSCAPVTIDDYRKLILEHFRGKVRNVHLSRKDTPLSFDRSLARKTGVESVDVVGRYQVRFELQDAYYSRKEEVLREIRSFLYDGYRNLCESFDFSDAGRKDTVMEKLSVGIHAKITIDREVRYDRLTRDIEKAIREYVTPSIPYHSFEELVEKGMALEEIFQGANPPDMDSFVTYGDLARLGRKDRLFLSDIKNIILSQKGVRSISHLGFLLPDGDRRAEVKNESLILTDELSVFCLEPFTFDGKSLTRIAYVINGIPFEVGKNIRYESEDDNSEPSSLPKGRPLAIVPEEGRYRESDVYLSPQNEFPAIYQLGKDEANVNDPVERRARRLQLKAYLTFFDQLLSDYLEQLTKVGRYLSWDVKSPTYYHHVLTDGEIADVSLVLGHYAGYEDGLDEDTFMERKNAVMDHLLARFNEVFVDYSLLRFVSGDDKLDFNLQDAVSDKARFLASYPETSSQRSQGAMLSAFAADPSLWHYGPIEMKIANKLGINQMPDVLSRLDGDREETFNENFGLHILEHNLLVPPGYSQLTPDVFLRLALEDDPERLSADPYTAQVTVVLPGWMKITRHSYFRAIVENLIMEEIPAHISVKICWLDRDVMRDIETAYPKYVASLWKGGSKKMTKNLTAVLEAMSRFRNIYPMSVVYDHDEMLIDVDHDDITELDFSAIGESAAERIEGLSISPASCQMEVGRIVTLTPCITPKGTDLSAFEWHSSRKDVASVDQEGRVFSMSSGEAIISYSDGAGHTAECVIRVVPAKCISKLHKPSGVKFEKKEMHVFMWSYFTKNPIRAYTFPPVANNDIIFESLDLGIARVSGELTTLVDYITAVAPGETWLVAKTASGVYADFCKVVVEGLRPGEVEMSVKTDVYVRNSIGKIQIICREGASRSGAILTSSNPSVICMTDDMGSFKTLALGESTVSLAYPGQEPLCSITLFVKENIYVCDFVPVESAPLEIYKVGWSQRVDFILNPLQQRVLSNLKYSSSDESVITFKPLTPASFDDGVVKYGAMVTAMGNGHATLTVEDEDGYARTGSLEIVVCEADRTVTGVELSEHELEVMISDLMIPLYAKVLPAEAPQNVYFESADPDIASVNSILTTSIIHLNPVSPGETTITVWDETRRFSDSMKVIVKGALKPGDVKLRSDKTEYVVGDEIYVYLDASAETDTAGCHFWPSDSAILQMEDRNLGVKAIAAGTATIYYGYWGQPLASLEFKISEPVSAQGIRFIDESVFKMYGQLGLEDRLMWYFVPEEPTDPRVTIASSDESVATCYPTGAVLDQDGRRVHVSMVKPVANGRALITITTLDGKVSASKDVQVGPSASTGIQLNAHELEISMSDYGVNAKALLATVFPEDASQLVRFESSNPGIVSVTDVLTLGNGRTLIEPVSLGEAVVTVYDEAGRFSDTCRVIVKGVKLEKAQIQSDRTEYPVGIRSKFWVSSEDDTSGCAFQSSNPSVLRFTDEYGSFETLSPGIVEVSFGYPESEPIASLTVRIFDTSSPEEEPESPDSMELTEPEMTVRKGDVFCVPFTVKPNGFEWKPENVCFVSSDESVLSVPDSHSNKIKAVGCGYGQVEIYYGTCSAVCEIIVCPAECDPKTFVPVDSFQLAASYSYSRFLKVGEKQTIRFDFKPDNATRVLSMSSSDQSVLRTDASDFSVEALALGKADVEVRSHYYPWPVKLSFEVGEKAALSLPERIEIDLNEGYEGIKPICPAIGEHVGTTQVLFEVDNESVLKVFGIKDESGRTVGNVVPIYPGEAVVTARLSSDPDTRSNPCRVILKGLRPGDVKLICSGTSFQVGESHKLATFLVNGKAISMGAEFMTSDPKILDFTDTNGWFKTLSPGLVVVSYGYPGHDPLATLEIQVIGTPWKKNLSAKKKEAIGEVLALLLAKDKEKK